MHLNNMLRSKLHRIYWIIYIIAEIKNFGVWMSLYNTMDALKYNGELHGRNHLYLYLR